MKLTYFIINLPNKENSAFAHILRKNFKKYFLKSLSSYRQKDLITFFFLFPPYKITKLSIKTCFDKELQLSTV